jgi:hypothetical protein
MFSNLLVEDLANAPPQSWARLVEQDAVIGQLAFQASVPVRQASVAAAKLSVNNRQIYKLLKARRERLAGAKASGPMTGCQPHIASEQIAVIDRAITAMGAGARGVAVYREVLRLTSLLGMEPPSKSTVGRHFAKAPHAPDLRQRFGTDADLIVDLCGLELNLIGADGSSSPAQLLAIVAGESGRIVRHKLFAGPPPIQEASELIRCSIQEQERGEKVTVSLSNPFHAVQFASLNTSLGLTGRAAHGRRAVPAGSVIASTMRGRVGRVRIRSDTRTWASPALFPGLATNLASAVIACLVEAHNLRIDN